MNTTEPQAQEAPTVTGVSAAVTFGEANVIITADDVATLQDFFSDHGILETNISEIRQTITVIGPVVALVPNITNIENA